MKTRINTILLWALGITSILGATKFMTKDLFTTKKDNLVRNIEYDNSSLILDIVDQSVVDIYTLAFTYDKANIETGIVYYGNGVSIEVKEIKNKVNNLKIYRYDFRPLLQKDLSLELKKVYIPLIESEEIDDISKIKKENKFYFYRGIEMPYNLTFKEVALWLKLS